MSETVHDFYSESGKYLTPSELRFLEKHGNDSVTLYRAIDSKVLNTNLGFFSSNLSPAQEDGRSGLSRIPDDWFGNELAWSVAETYVPGLPVFLERNMAINWGTKNRINSWYLGVLKIPLRELRGKNSLVKVMTNTLQTPGRSAIHLELDSWSLLGENDMGQLYQQFSSSECYLRLREIKMEIPEVIWTHWKQEIKQIF